MRKPSEKNVSCENNVFIEVFKTSKVFFVVNFFEFLNHGVGLSNKKVKTPIAQTDVRTEIT